MLCKRYTKTENLKRLNPLAILVLLLLSRVQFKMSHLENGYTETDAHGAETGQGVPREVRRTQNLPAPPILPVYSGESVAT